MVPEEAAGSKKEVKTFPFNPVTLTKGLGCNMAKSHTMPRLCMVGTCNGEKMQLSSSGAKQVSLAQVQVHLHVYHLAK